MSKAKILFADGKIKQVSPANGEKFTLEELQGFVGGYIEILTAKHGRLLIVNKEGRLKKLPKNKNAKECHLYGEEIVGDVLLTNSKLIQS